MTGWSSRSDTEAGAALIALNRITELGGWVDEELDHLRELLDTITDDPPDAGDDVGTSRATERLYVPDRPRHGHQP